MIAYASRTGTRQNLRALRLRGWRLLSAPQQLNRYRSVVPIWDDGSAAPYCLDNGAWTAHQQGSPFDVDLFRAAVSRLGLSADFVVAPDIVGGGLDSLAFSASWLRYLSVRSRLVLIPAQDGMKPAHMAGIVGPRVGVFLGGSTEWKLANLREWGQFARSRGCYFHVGRVNSVRRINACIGAGADSFDGTSLTRFSCNANKLDHARRQLGLWSSHGA